MITVMTMIMIMITASPMRTAITATSMTTTAKITNMIRAMITAMIIRIPIRTIMRRAIMAMAMTTRPAAITIMSMARAPTISIITARCRKRSA